VVVWAADVVVLVLVLEVEVFTEVVRVVAALVEVEELLPDEEPPQVKTSGPVTRRQYFVSCIFTTIISGLPGTT
jgi:hypothetical protein